MKNKKELEFILQQGEGLKIEFKENICGLDKEIIAMANSEGGRIFLGVDDNNIIKGIKIDNKLKLQIQDIARNCDPAVKIILEEFETVLIIDVKEGEDKPYGCKSGFYLRQGANSQKLIRDEIIELIVGLGKVKFDEQLNEKFIFKNDFDNENFDGFLKEAKISETLSVENILVNLSLGNFVSKKFKINNAGILFFAKEPEKFFRQNFITCVLYKGDERVDIIDRKDFKKDLVRNYQDGISFLKQHLKLKYIIKGTGPRKEVLELPEEALRESLLNSIVHRDYFDDGVGIFVEIFDNRVEINNKGKLLFDKSKLGEVSVLRNPILSDIFHRIGDIEKVGSGINRIKKLVRERNLKMKFDVDDFFRIIFYRSKTTQKTTQKIIEVNEGVNEGVNLLLNSIKNNPGRRIPYFEKELRASPKTIERWIKKLKEENKIMFQGSSKKGGYWEVRKNENQ